MVKGLTAFIKIGEPSEDQFFSDIMMVSYVCATFVPAMEEDHTQEGE